MIKTRKREKRIRLVRELVYEGGEEWLNTTLSNSYVPREGVTHFAKGSKVTSRIVEKEELDNGVTNGDQGE
jgi:hypothetical protein